MKKILIVLAGGLSALACMACILPEFAVHNDYHDPERKKVDELADDRLEDKPDQFDPSVVDRRPLKDWLVNGSAAVIKLHIAAVKPDAEKDMLRLYPCYADAIRAVQAGWGREVLPSVNMIDGKGKQFDDGLYAALDLAYYQGRLGKLRGHVELMRRIYAGLDPKSEAAGFVAAGLSLAGVKVEGDHSVMERHLRAFQNDETASKPCSFYTWGQDLTECFRFLRFFMHAFDANDAIPRELTHAVAADPTLAAEYRQAVDFYAKLSNPARCSCLLPPANADPNPPQPITPGGLNRPPVAVFPPASTREQALFARIFPFGLPPSADLMGELIRAIRSGKVSLAPTAESGWYEYQVHALETLLLPEKGEESGHLLLTKEYKKRMQEAFKALITKRLETHARVISPFMMGMAMPPMDRERPDVVRPRLRVEPNPTFYLRTARAYAFLADFLETAVGKEGLEQLHPAMHPRPSYLTPRCQFTEFRAENLYAGLHTMKEFFYGLYLVSSEDIGQKPTFLPKEPVAADRCYQAAADWLKLEKSLLDEDIAQDARVAVTILSDPTRKVSRIWATLGVRLDKLDASYARAPHIKPKEGPGEWERVAADKLKPAEYLIAVDEFAEIELSGKRVFTRAEWRALCDLGQTKEGILAAAKNARSTTGGGGKLWPRNRAV